MIPEIIFEDIIVTLEGQRFVITTWMVSKVNADTLFHRSIQQIIRKGKVIYERT